MKTHLTRALVLIYTYACLLAPVQSMAAQVALSDQPLFLPVKVDPNIMLSLATQWPMAETAAYTDLALTDPNASSCPGLVTDAAAGHVGNVNLGDASTQVGVCYFESQTYQGYFDPAKCYTYNTSAAYFTAVASATAHRCSSAWSGNLLNWATMTTVDEFRWATTGGTRDLDLPASSSTSPGLTVLKRAVKYRGPNDSVFRLKRITQAGVPNTSVAGVPSSLVTPLGVDTTLYFGNQGGNLLVWAGGPGVTGLVADSTVTVPPDNAPGHAAVYPLGGFQVRVAVCDATVSRESNCQPYNDSSQATPVVTWKPTGLIQAYAASMRFGVASYLYDSTPNLNGGVLRSNIKYVGAQTKDPALGNAPNALQEWSPTTGVLVANPGDPANPPVVSCSAGTGCSGVINYINGFGYANGNYMSYGPVAELYYEVLRYFVNPAHGPTQDYLGGAGGASTSQRDGFPVVSRWQDPIQYSCQKNVIVQVGDSDAACDFNLPGNAGGSTLGSGQCLAHNSHSLANTSGSAENWANVVNFTNSVGQLEGLSSTLGGSFGGGLTPYTVFVPPAPSGAPTPGGPGGPAGPTPVGSGNGGPSPVAQQLPDSWYLAGLAWWAHVNDIRADSGTQDASQGFQNVTSYFVDVQKPGSWGWGRAAQPGQNWSGSAAQPNQYWLAAKYGGFSFSTPGVPDSAPTSLASWSSNGTTPDNYLYGGKPLTLVNRLAALFASVTGGSGSLASIGSSGTAVQAGSLIFQGAANTSDWSGHLYAYTLNASGALSTVPVDAASLLAATSADNRVILSWNEDTSSTVPFRLASLSASAQVLLGGATGTDTKLVNYLRGDHSNEGTGLGQFRLRRSTFPGNIAPSAYTLGDITDSTPVYVGPVQPDGLSTRTPMVYVGANDGMLHAFSAQAGSGLLQEKFAFLPSAVIGQLPALADPGYSHQYYVDGSPTVAETLVGTTPRTVLAEILHKGGRGVFALDITHPDTWSATESGAASASPVIWQFSSAVDADLGYTFGDAQIVKTAALDANGHNRWAVVVGNGYNGTGSGQAAVFLIFLDRTPTAQAPWVAGQDYIKLSTSVAAANVGTPSGMATPAVISADGSGVASTVYAGDLLGNLWKFDISNADPSQWGSRIGVSGGAVASVATTPLYTAKTPAGVAQPITTAPEVVKFPRGGWMVLFGTGRALAGSDLSDVGLQTFYGIRDTNVALASRDLNPNLLQAQQILSSSLTVVNPDNSTSRYRQVSSTQVLYPAKSGWYLDLIDNVGATPGGERLVFNPAIDLGRIAFTTLVPSGAQDTSTCQGGGTSWNMLLDPYSGAALNRAVFDVNKDLAFDSDDTLTGADGSTQIYAAGVQSSNGVQGNGLTLLMPYGCGGSGCQERIQTGSNGLTAARFEAAGASFQRLSWREISSG